jgi:hypothetical protein
VEGAPDSETVTPQARGLLAQLDQLAGRRALTQAFFHGDTGPLARQLQNSRDQPRVRALLAALRAGNLDLATRLAADPNPALADTFSGNLYLALGDLFTAQSGGEPVDPAHARLAQHLADVVGQQVVERAYFDGDVDSLQAVLRADVEDAGVQRFRDAMNEPRPDIQEATGVLAQTSIRQSGLNLQGRRATSPDEIIARLQREFDALGPEATQLPPDWSTVRDYLRKSPLAANKRIDAHIDTYLRGVQNPRLIMDVLSAAIRRAWTGRRSINWALREMARESAAARGIPLETIPHRRGQLFSNDEFFSWAFRRSYFIDLVLVGPGDHTANAHLVQDLVADRAFVRAGEAMSGPEFRHMLASAQGTLVLSPSANAALPPQAHGAPVNVGRLIWFLINDTFVNYFPRPELIGRLTRDTGMH